MFAPSKSRTDVRPGRPRGFAAIAVVCVILLALLAVVQVAHTHQGVTDADHCSLCIVMHTAAPVLTAAALISLVRLAMTGSGSRIAHGYLHLARAAFHTPTSHGRLGHPSHSSLPHGPQAGATTQHLKKKLAERCPGLHR